MNIDALTAINKTNNALVKLTAKQSVFVDEYLIDLNATQAAIRAGYSRKTAAVIGNENLIKPYIAEAIQNAMEARSQRTQIDADWVLTASKQVFDRCMQEEPVLDHDGNPTGEYKFEHTGANKALDTIGKNVLVKAFNEDKAGSNQLANNGRMIINIISSKKEMEALEHSD